MEKEFYARVFEEVLRLTNDGFIVVDDKAVVIDINDSYSSFLGRKKRYCRKYYYRFYSK